MTPGFFASFNQVPVYRKGPGWVVKKYGAGYLLPLSLLDVVEHFFDVFQAVISSVVFEVLAVLN